MMSRKHITWSDFDGELITQIAKDIKIPGDPIEGLTRRYGVRPNEMFIRDAMPSLLAYWLAKDSDACLDIAESARKHGLGNKDIIENYRYLSTCRNSKYLRHVMLTRLLAAGRATNGSISIKATSSSQPEVDKSNVSRHAHSAEPNTTAIANNLVSASRSQHEMPYENNQQSIYTSLAGRHSPKERPLRYIVAAGIAVISTVTASAFISSHTYSRTVRLGEEKHVRQLLALPESGPHLQEHLDQLNDFRESGWRNYLSKSSIMELDQKGLRLNRAIEVESLRRQINRLPIGKLDPETIDSHHERLSKILNANAFEYLEEGEKERLGERLSQASLVQQEISRRKEEEEQRARQRAQAERRAKVEAEARKRQAEERQAAAARQAAQEAQEASQNQTSMYETGPRGGCFYWSGNSKVYVDRSNCY